MIWKDWGDIIIHSATLALLWQIYDVVKNIRKVQYGEIGDDTMSEFASTLLKGTKELNEEKKKQEKKDMDKRICPNTNCKYDNHAKGANFCILCGTLLYPRKENTN